jgi:hypothetical protein
MELCIESEEECGPEIPLYRVLELWLKDASLGKKNTLITVPVFLEYFNLFRSQSAGKEMSRAVKRTNDSSQNPPLHLSWIV